VLPESQSEKTGWNFKNVNFCMIIKPNNYHTITLFIVLTIEITRLFASGTFKQSPSYEFITLEGYNICMAATFKAIRPKTKLQKNSDY